MKICHVLETSGGGSGRHVLDLCEHLVRRGHEVHVAYSPLRAEADFLAGLHALVDVALHEVPIETAPSLSDIKSVGTLRQALRHYGPFEVVHSHSSKAGAIGRVAAWLEQTPSVYTPHAMASLNPTLSRQRRGLYNTTERILARVASEWIICVSDSERQHAADCGWPLQKIVVVPNGVKPGSNRAASRGFARRKLGLADTTVCVGYVGRMVPQKDPQCFLSAIRPLATRYPTLQAVMIGEGPLMSEVEAAAKGWEIDEKVMFLGAQAAAELMPAFDVFVLTSRYEALPYVLLEALAAGLPIVTFDVGGASETVVDDRNGFVIDAGQTERMTHKVGLLLEDRNLRSRMSEASMAHARNFSVERMVESTEAVYRRVSPTLRPRKAPRPETVPS